MTLDNLIALITAGFTKDEILTMSGTATQRAPQPQPHPQPQPQPHPQPHPQDYPQTPVQGVQGYAHQFPQGYTPAYPQAQPQAQAYPQTQAQQARQIADNNDVLSALKSLTSAVQNNNVNLMQNAVPKQVTTEDVIASIINPPNYEGLTGGEK